MSEDKEWLDFKKCLSFQTLQGRVHIFPAKDINDTAVGIRVESKTGEVQQFGLTMEAVLSISDAANYYAIDKQIRKLEEVKTQGESNESNT